MHGLSLIAKDVFRWILGIYIKYKNGTWYPNENDPSQYPKEIKLIASLLKTVNPLLDTLFVIGIIAIAGGLIYAAFMFAYGDEKQKATARSILMGAILAGVILTILGPLISYFIPNSAWSLFTSPP